VKLVQLSRIFTWILFGICAVLGFFAMIGGIADPTTYGEETLGQGVMLIIGAAWVLIITLLIAAIAENTMKQMAGQADWRNMKPSG
jgi:uncharacterized membrane protein